MAEKKIQMQHHNGTGWDTLYPVTKADNVEMESGESVETVINNIDVDLDNTGKGLTEVQNALANKVDKETGKGLSTNDFTNAYKTKVDNMQTVAVQSTAPNTTTSPVWFQTL